MRIFLNLIRRLTPFSIRNNYLFKKIFTFSFFHLFLINKLKKQLSIRKTKLKDLKKYNRKKIFIPLFETSHNQYHQLLIIGKALELRGCEVRVLVCNGFLNACEIKSIKNINYQNNCWNCKFNLKNIIPLYDLKTYDIDSLISKDEIYKIQSILSSKNFCFADLKKYLDFEIKKDKFESILEESVVRFFYGKVDKDDYLYKKVRTDNILTLLISSLLAKKVDNDWSPDFVVSNMFVYSTWAPFFQYFNKRGKRYKTLSITQFNTESVIINSYDLYPSKERYHQFISSIPEGKLNISQNKELDDFITNRFSGNNQVALDESYFKNLEKSQIKNQIKLNSKKRNIFLFSNIYWDVGINEMSFLYKDVISWVKDTINIISNSNNINLYIKTHPGEYYDKSKTLKGVADFIREEFGNDLPGNVFFIEPFMKIKPYDLFPHIDLGVIFSGTLGLEMMLNEIPVVSTGITPHLDLGFANEPKTKDEYEMILNGEFLLNKPKISDIRKFAYFYFIKSCIPWDISEKIYGGFFNGFNIDCLDDLEPGKNKILDHICNSLIKDKNHIIENW